MCVQEFVRLTQAMVDNKPTAPGPSPPDLTPKQWSFLPPVVIDSVPSGVPLANVLSALVSKHNQGCGRMHE